MKRHIRKARRPVYLLAICTVAGTTCDNPIEPIVYEQIELARVAVSDLAVLSDSGLLVIAGEPVDTTHVLRPNERLRFELTTSSGDSESFALGPIICDEATLACHDVSVLMKSGHHVSEIFSPLTAVPARFYRTSFSGSGGGVFVFHPERLSGALLMLQKHPAVASAEHSHAAALPAPRRWLLRGGLPLDIRPVTPHDGVLQGQPGDTIMVRYMRPNESLLELSIVIPSF